MNRIAIYYVDAFTDQLFQGNPAAVCLLEHKIDDELLHKIARENNQPVTAFLIPEKDHMHIRWITPEMELPLCGHGTFAASYVLFHVLNHPQDTISFLSPHAGLLTATRDHDRVTLDFPAKLATLCPTPQLLIEGLSAIPLETYVIPGDRLFAVFETAEQIKAIQPRFEILKQLNERGITITAASEEGQDCDVVSRVFYPEKLIPEDQVTGASHCMIIPYWAEKLGKNRLFARQLSKRGGSLWCELKNDRVLLSGHGVLYAEGHLTIRGS